MAEILSWGYLSRAEAEALDDQWRRMEPDRIAWLDHQLLAAGLPASDTIDYTDLWSWFLRWPGGEDDVAGQADPVWITPSDRALSYSKAQAVATDAIAVAFAARLLSRHPELVRSMGPKPKGKVPPLWCNEPGLFKRETGDLVLELAGFADTCARELFKAEHGADTPDLLNTWAVSIETDHLAAPDAQRLASNDAEPWSPPVEVERSEDDEPDYKWTLWVDDVVAHDQEDLVARFVTALSTLRGVSEAYHQDREQILIAGTVSKADLIPFVHDWWMQVSE